VSWRCFW